MSSQFWEQVFDSRTLNMVVAHHETNGIQRLQDLRTKPKNMSQILYHSNTILKSYIQSEELFSVSEYRIDVIDREIGGFTYHVKTNVKV